MKALLHLFKYPVLGCAGFYITPYIPEAELLVILKYLLLGGITGSLCSSILKLCEWAKGDTKKLLTSEALTGREQVQLAQVIRWRSAMLWNHNLAIWFLMGVGWVFYLINSNGFWKPYSVRLSMCFVFMAAPLFITILLAWRDYVLAKEQLERREAGVADAE